MAKLRTRRQNRRSRLSSEGFTRREAYDLSQFLFKQPYIRQMRKDRRELVRNVLKQGLSKAETRTELRWQIRKIYEINGWKDAYAMLRDYRNRSIERGEYQPPPPKKRPKLDKGNVAAQKKRYQARKSAESKGRTGVQFDSRGEVIGWVEYSQETGRFEARYE